MANYGGDQVAVKFGANTMTQYVTAIGTVETSVTLEKSTPFGVTWEQYLSAVLKSMKAIKIDGFYDDTATTGPDAVWGTANLGTSATLEIDIGGTKKFTVSAFVQDYQRIFKVGALTKYSVTLQPSGSVSET